MRVTDRQFAFVGIERDAFNLIECFHMSRLLCDLFAILHEGRGDVALTCFKDLHLAVLIDGGDLLIAGSEIKRNVGRIFRLAFRFDCGFVCIVEFDFQGIGNLQFFRRHLDGDNADILHLGILDRGGNFSLTGCDCRNGAGLIDRSNTLIGGSPRERQLLSRLGNLFILRSSFCRSRLTGCDDRRLCGRILRAEIYRQRDALALFEGRSIRNRNVRDLNAASYQAERHSRSRNNCQYDIPFHKNTPSRHLAPRLLFNFAAATLLISGGFGFF